MAETNSTTEIEREKADRFGPARAGYLVWTKEQGKKVRELEAAREAEAAPEDPPEDPQVALDDKFNA